MVPRLSTSVLVCMLFVGSALAAGTEPVADESMPVFDGAGALLHSSGTASGLAARETTGPDTFLLYGGPDHPTEGKFQLANGTTPDWGGGNGLPGGYGGGPDAWTPVDLTYEPAYWTVDMFNAENLNNNGPGNHAMWCGLSADHPETEYWVNAPGYGNSWLERLIYESDPIANPGIGQTVTLDFFFNYETEAGFDYFHVEYDSAGTWTSVLSLDGSNKDSSNQFAPPGVQFSAVQTKPITYSGGDYGGFGSDQIRIRLAFRSDGAWSDQDGLLDTDGGAVQVDDITLTHSDGSFSEGFEGAGPFLFEPDVISFAGDFADVFPAFSDIDPCRGNGTPVAGFIDYGQVVRNGPGVYGDTSTSGTTWTGIDYGIPGNYVVNWTGGLSSGERNLKNDIWSPDILWDLPGTDDDDPSIAGAFVTFDVWLDQTPTSAIFFKWDVHTAFPGQDYGWWRHADNFPAGLYYFQTTGWRALRYEMTNRLKDPTERLRILLGVEDWTGRIGGASGATPAPVFDNVAVYKYRLPGPMISARTSDVAQDGFPTSGSIDVSTPAARDALDIPFDMARDVNSGHAVNAPGDSIVVEVDSAIPGATVTDIRMFWALNTNVLFEDALRAAPVRTKDENVVAGASGTVWTGEVVADSSFTSGGGWVADWYFADLPDVDFMYPGDVVHYYFQAVDSDGRTSTLPYDLSGFGVFGPDSTYDRTFTVRGLPSISDASSAQPEILVVNHSGHGDGVDEVTTAFRNLGYSEGIDFDTYAVQGPYPYGSNGIGSSGGHGATAGQLAGYEHMFLFAGDLTAYVLSDGSNEGTNTKSDDFDLLEDWHALAGTRNMAYFGDNMGTALASESAAGAAYLVGTMGVDYLDNDVRDAIGDQLAPVTNVSPYGATWFATEFVANGGCQSINEFDQFQPVVGAEAGHYFTSTGGTPITDPSAGVASVIYPTAGGVDITFPFSIKYIQNVLARDAGASSRTQLFAEILGLFSAAPGGVPVAAPGLQPVVLGAIPNPFNPVTVVKFTAPIGSKGSVKVFNLRGELVRTLHAGEFVQQEFRWDGVDQNGASVASGVYVIKAETEGKAQTTKVALVK